MVNVQLQVAVFRVMTGEMTPGCETVSSTEVTGTPAHSVVSWPDRSLTKLTVPGVARLPASIVAVNVTG